MRRSRHLRSSCRPSFPGRRLKLHESPFDRSSSPPSAAAPVEFSDGQGHDDDRLVLLFLVTGSVFRDTHQKSTKMA
ncbi:hypothetical protein GQ457_04G026200 [Hibiscus cannabinus]